MKQFKELEMFMQFCHQLSARILSWLFVVILMDIISKLVHQKFMVSHKGKFDSRFQ